jgi:dTMP kinase
LTFYIDVPIQEGLERRNQGHRNGEELNRMDTQTCEFYKRVLDGYATLMRAEPARWVRIEGSRPIEEIQQEMREHVACAFRK